MVIEHAIFHLYNFLSQSHCYYYCDEPQSEHQIYQDIHAAILHKSDHVRCNYDVLLLFHSLQLQGLLSICALEERRRLSSIRLLACQCLPIDPLNASNHGSSHLSIWEGSIISCRVKRGTFYSRAPNTSIILYHVRFLSCGRSRINRLRNHRFKWPTRIYQIQHPYMVLRLNNIDRHVFDLGQYHLCTFHLPLKEEV